MENIHFFWLNVNGPVGMSVGVSILATECRGAGFNVRVSHISDGMGYPFEVERIRADVREGRGDVFALSFSSTQMRYVPQLVELIRSERPDALVFCGGVHAMTDPESLATVAGVDGICVSEADSLFVDLLKKIEASRDWRDTPGFWFLARGQVVRNAPAAFPDISRQSGLDFEHIDYRELIRRKSGFAEMLLGRGCHYRCSFCQNHILSARGREASSPRPYVRWRHVDNILTEIREFERVGGDVLKGLIFGDDSIYYDRRWLMEFLEAYGRSIGLPFIAFLVANQVDADLAQALYRANCNVIRIGIEIADEQKRKRLLGKPVTNKSITAAASVLHEAGINVQGFGMYALPHETRKDVLKLLKLCADLRLDVFRLSTFLPLPGTRLHSYCMEHGLMRGSDEYSDFNTASILSWDGEMRLFYEKIRHSFPLLLNAQMPGRTGALYGHVANGVLQATEVQWQKLKTTLAGTEKELRDMCISDRQPHYCALIPERPDYVFLHLPGRMRKMINIDDQDG